MNREKFVASIIQNVVKIKSRSSFNLTAANVKDYPEPDLDKEYLLYLHIPFCKTFCSYCTFYKIKYEATVVKNYFASLQADIRKAHKKGYKFQGVYIGGGTPTLAPELLAETIDLLKSLFDIKEVSCEGNPDIDNHVVELLKDRVDRMSVGVQSFQNTFLDKSQRLKKYGDSNELQEKLSHVIENFKIVNFDMIFNFFDQTEQELLEDIKVIKKLSPHQIAYYPLMNSKYSKIEKLYGGYSQKNELAYYKIITDAFSEEYNQVGSWSFTKKGGKFFDEYVVNNDEYLGLGAGAFSYINNVLYANTFNVDEYNRKIAKQLSTIQLKKSYGYKDQLKYRLMLKLFANNFDPESFNQQYGSKSTKVLAFDLAFLKMVNTFTGNDYSLTQSGKYYAMVMMKEFYIGMNELRARLQ